MGHWDTATGGSGVSSAPPNSAACPAPPPGGRPTCTGSGSGSVRQHPLTSTATDSDSGALSLSVQPTTSAVSTPSMPWHDVKRSSRSCGSCMKSLNSPVTFLLNERSTFCSRGQSLLQTWGGPSMSLTSAQRPWKTRLVATSYEFMLAARCSPVTSPPSSSVATHAMPELSLHRPTSSSVPHAANGTSREYFGVFTSKRPFKLANSAFSAATTSAPFSNSRSTTSAWPARAAAASAVSHTLSLSPSPARRT
mmetsp:Transcript_36926/g.99420  ORF Transcript_36926/g.99420 Transcript_36926/m.99420 type:complete len:251 (+) Transcript_36926:250-1002(+)